VRITELRPEEDKVTASIRQALPAAIAAEKLNVGDIVSGLVSQVHSEQVVITILPAQLTALLSLSTLANHRQTGIDELRKELKIGEKLEGLVVVSKNPTSGLLVLSTKRSNTSQSQSLGISKPMVSFESLTPGEIVSGTVIEHAGTGTQIELPNGLKGRVHPCDATDDLGLIASGEGPLNVGQEVKCLVLKVNPHTRIIDLSTRQSRVDPENAGEVVDREITSIDNLKEGQSIRGLVKNVTQHGLFVALGRSVVARVKIRELFDEVSFTINLYRVERMLISSLSKTGNLHSTTTNSYPDVSYLWTINVTLSN
jgi:rRNA biogenesis protein RRP5